MNEKYKNIFKEVFGIDGEVDVHMKRADNKKWDSLLHLTLMTAMEDEFGIMLDTDDILNFNSYEKGLEIIKKYVEKA